MPPNSSEEALVTLCVKLVYSAEVGTRTASINSDSYISRAILLRLSPGLYQEKSLAEPA